MQVDRLALQEVLELSDAPLAWPLSTTCSSDVGSRAVVANEAPLLELLAEWPLGV